MRKGILFAWLGIIAPMSLSAATYLVRPDGTGDFPTIQAAISAVADGDVIQLADGLFTGEGNRDIDFQGKSITVQSLSADPASCVIDCQGSEADHHRGFDFLSGEGPDATLAGITITHGYVESEDAYPDGLGGGIRVLGGSSPTLSNLVIESCTAMAGGGLFSHESSTPTLTGCKFIQNTAWWGSGGAMSVYQYDGTITDCLFQENSGFQVGGGVATADSSPTLTDCMFIGNRVDNVGGGFECSFGCEPTLLRCTFAENKAQYSGGGILSWDGAQATIRSCTFVRNDATDGGGVSCQMNGTATLTNTIIAFGNIGEAVTCDATGHALLNCCDLFGNGGGDWVDCVANQASVTGNMELDPLFCGEQTPAHPYMLTDDSPCGPPHYPCSLIGAWPVGCESVADVPASGDARAGVVLYPGFPNPFNPSVAIRFDLAGPSRVQLTILSLRGARVRLLLDEAMPAGIHRISWDGRDDAGREVGTGAYICRLQAGELTRTSRLLLAR